MRKSRLRKTCPLRNLFWQLLCKIILNRNSKEDTFSAIGYTIFLSSLWLHLSKKMGKKITLLSLVFFRWKNEHQNRSGNAPSMSSCVLQANRLHLGTWKHQSRVLREEVVYVFQPGNDSKNVDRRTYISANIEFDISAHGERTAVKG